MNKTISLILIFLSLAISARAAEPVLSNTLPTAVVRGLVEAGYWEAAFDQNDSQESRELNQFWRSLQPAANTEIAAVVDSVFAASSARGGETVRLSRLYPVKLFILRQLREQSNSSTRLQKIYQAWMERYVDIALSTIELGNISEYSPILANFRKKIRANQVRLVDLSPLYREKMQSEMPASHGVELVAKDSRTNQYRVNGFFHEGRQLFAVDFARPLEETLITFAHEIVHAADPLIEGYRREYETLSPQALQILTNWLESAPDAKKLAADIVDHVYFETGLEGFQSSFRELRKKRIEQLRASVTKPNSSNDEKGLQPKPEEIEILRRWTKAALGMSVENEYRAYGLSVTLYAVLKTRLQILPVSKERQALVEKLMAGEGLLAAQISLTMNPFRESRSNLLDQFLRKEQREANPNSQTRYVYMRIGQVLNQLELLYLEETEKFLQSTNGSLQKNLQGISLIDLQRENPLPEWARPGGFDLPSNPFQILSARITTAWTLRFSQNVDLFIQDVKQMNEPLANMQIGILDLHDVNRGERKLIGISYENSPWANDPEEIDPKLKSDLDSIPLDISKYFAVAKWSPEVIGGGSALDSQAIMRNLVRLRTLKSTAWLDLAFPDFRTTLLGVRSFLQRLREGVYNSEELSKERVLELEQELVGVWRRTPEAANQIQLLRILLSELGLLYETAEQSQWREISLNLQQKMRFVAQSLDSLGVAPSESRLELDKRRQDSKRQLQQQLQRHYQNCQRMQNDYYRLGGFWPDPTPFEYLGNKFPLTIVCHNQKLYLVRQPGDFLKFMTTLVKDGVPEARIFIGSRPVKLLPENIFDKRDRR